MTNNSNVARQQESLCNCHLTINKLTRSLREHKAQSQINIQVIRNMETELNEANAKIEDYENIIRAMQRAQIEDEKLYLSERAP